MSTYYVQYDTRVATQALNPSNDVVGQFHSDFVAMVKKLFNMLCTCSEHSAVSILLDYVLISLIILLGSYII